MIFCKRVVILLMFATQLYSMEDLKFDQRKAIISLKGWTWYLLCQRGFSGPIIDKIINDLKTCLPNNLYDGFKINIHVANIVQTLEGEESIVDALAINYDGTKLVSGSRNNIIKIWDLTNLKCEATLPGSNEGFVRKFEFSSDGKAIAWKSNSGFGEVWDIKQEKVISNPEWLEKIDKPKLEYGFRIEKPDEDLNICIASADVLSHYFFLFDPTRSTIVNPERKIIARLKFLERWFEYVLPHDDTVARILLSPDGQMLASCSMDNTIKIWDLASLKKHVHKDHSLEELELLKFYKDGNELSPSQQTKLKQMGYFKPSS